MEHIEKLFKSRNRAMPERNRVQAMFPESSQIIPNPHGTAPGIDLQVQLAADCDRQHICRLFALPGVPAEMIQMLSHTVEHRLVDEMGLGDQRWYYHSLKLFGLGESDVEKVIPDLIARDRIPRVGITVSKATITLRIADRAPSHEQFMAGIQPTVDQIHAAFGDVIFAEGETELHEVVHEILRAKNQTLSLVEVGAGCWVGQMLSEGFAPSPTSGLKHATWMPTVPPVPDPGWLASLALDSQRDHQTDYALAVGVYPPACSFTFETSLPTTDLQIVIVGPGGDKSQRVLTKTQRVSGHPELFYQRLAKTALDLLRRELLCE
jgi:nicotinamide-nucleotide amidase